MEIEGVFTTIYFVDDWERSVAFYRDTLGLKPTHVEPGWAEFRVGANGSIALHQRERHDGTHSEVPQVSLQVRDIEGTLRELTAAGAKQVEALRRAPFGSIASVADPSGNVINLYEPPRS
jgi:predicted enzyme related to lactoylglutathione lyase